MEEKYYKVGNRISGLVMAVFGGIIAFNTDHIGLDIAGSLLVIEGAGDLISGRHHYLSTNLLRYFTGRKIDIRYFGDPKFKSKKLEDELF